MIPGSANPLLLKSAAAAAGGYQIERSLRFNSSDSGFCSRTPAVAGDRTKWTWAGWVKRSGLSTTQRIFSSSNSGNTEGFYCELVSGDALSLYDYSNPTIFWQKTTSQVFRDASAWFHLQVSFDSANGTPGDRVKIYVNSVRVENFSTSSNPSPSYNSYWNAARVHAIGRTGDSNAGYFNGYLADIHFIDGQALTPSSFTEVSATTGQLIPKAYSGGSYGTNGFYLQFADNSSNTATTLGKDTSGNSNNWTPNNLSVTAGAGNDSLIDTPTSFGTDTGVGGDVRGNYATLNPLQLGANITLSNGNLDGSQPSGGGTNTGVTGTIGLSSGKWYWETKVNTRPSGTYTVIGIASSAWRQASTLSFSDPVWIYYGAGTKQGNGSEVAYGASYGAGDVIGVAFDADNGTLTFYKNGVSQGTAFTGLTSGPYFPIVGKNEGACAWTWSCNFGQRPFAYQTPGTNRPAATFLALCDTNLGAPLVAKPNTLMDVALYTGNGSTQSITGLAFSPDLVWIKCRSAANGHALTDVVRGSSQRLFSELTDAEDSTASLTSFDSNGFSVSTAGGSTGRTNLSSTTYVAWTWDAGTSTVTNTAGSITSQVRANVSAGFSVVTYTGNNTDGATVGHGLGVTPALVITKSRSASSLTGWMTKHSSLASNYNLALNLTDAAWNPSTNGWVGDLNSSTVFTLKNGSSNGNNANQSGVTYVAYCFAPVVGFSSFGSYVGNGSTDGPFVFTGFRTRWLMIKATSISGESWVIKDSARGTYNPNDPNLYADLSIAEQTSNSARYIDFTSNGFKLRGTEVSVNGSSNTYIYMAFAENPFQYARAR